jgi:predicted secreted protein
MFSFYLNKILMKTSSSQTIHLKPQEHYTLTLKGRSTAGYQWISSTDSENIISVTKKMAPQNEDSQKRIGVASDEVFTITALQKGKAVVHFKQLRIWETVSKPLEEKIVIVVIE